MKTFLLIFGKMVVMASLGLLVYLLLYPDRFFEGFWINMKMEGIHRTFLFRNLLRRDLLLYSLGRLYRRESSQLCILSLVANRSIVGKNPNSPYMK